MFRKKHQGNDYDAIIIGTGIGGLVAGAYLAKAGARVMLYEHHSQPGGYSTSFTRQGFTFDGGIQACEDCGMLFSVLRQIGVLDRVELKKTKFGLATPDHFAVLDSLENVQTFYRELLKVYPDQAAGINRIVEDIGNFCRVMEAYCQLPNPMFGPLSPAVTKYPGWRKKYKGDLKHSKEFMELMKIPLDVYLENRLSNPDLILFIKQMMYAGAPASFTLSFYYFVMDYYHPKGGFQSISNALADFVIEKGGKIQYKTLVEQIVLENGRAAGVRLKTGEVVRAPYIVSNSDARRTFLKMLPPEATPETYRWRLAQTPVSDSAVSVFLGVDIPAEEIKTRDCKHIYYLPDYKGVDVLKSLDDEEVYTRAPVEICIPSLEDPTMAPPGKTAIVLQSLAYMNYANNWGTENGKRTEKYKALKEKVSNQMIASAEKLIPGLSGKIVFKTVGTPYTNERYTLNSEGATAGWTYNPTKAMNTGWEGMKGFQTPVKNLYLVGHWTMSPGGAPAGFMSGRIVSSLIKWRLRLRV